MTMHKHHTIPVFILAGGLGTRLSEETVLKPKPMVEVGEIPMLLHIMKSYYAHGFDDFVICAGYRAWLIKEFFLNYNFHCNHIEIDHREDPKREPEIIGKNSSQEKWRVRVIDTGLEAMTGARIARAHDVVWAKEPFEAFAVTYGDGVSDVDLEAELNFHSEHKKIGTVLGVRPVARFGELETSAEGTVQGFLEKPKSKQGRINGGFFFFKNDFRKYLNTDDSCILERAPLENLAKDGQLSMYQHDGFWHPMDTLRDKNYLNELWMSGKAPWKKN